MELFENDVRILCEDHPCSIFHLISLHREKNLIPLCNFQTPPMHLSFNLESFFTLQFFSSSPHPWSFTFKRFCSFFHNRQFFHTKYQKAKIYNFILRNRLKISISKIISNFDSKEGEKKKWHCYQRRTCFTHLCQISATSIRKIFFYYL